MNPDLILSLDVGTQSSRAILHDRNGSEVAIGRSAHAPLLTPFPRAVFQDPEDIWRALTAASKACLEDVDPARVVAVALTSQRSGVIPCDEEGQPLHPIVSWLDRRSARKTPLLQNVVGNLIHRMPQDSPLPRIAGWSRPNILFEQDPDLYHATRMWLTISGWLTHRLTGEAADATGSIAGVWPYDPKKGDWRSDALAHRLLGFKPGSLPRLVGAGEQLGKLHAQGAAALGVEAGLPLIAVGGDKQAEALGGGVDGSNTDCGAVSLGTAASVCVVDRQCRSSAFLHYITNSAAEPGAWVREVMVMRGYWLISWFVREFAAEERLEAERLGESPEALLSEKVVEAVPPGAGGLMLLPRFTPSSDIPIERGAILGLSEEHGRLALFRAILEGIGFDLRRGLEVLERSGGRRVKTLRVGGGGARSDLALSATASILGRPLELGATRELSALGASICAATAVGWYPTPADAVKGMTRVTRRVDPDPRLTAFYDRQYRKAFVPSLRIVRPLTAWLARNGMEE